MLQLINILLGEDTLKFKKIIIVNIIEHFMEYVIFSKICVIFGLLITPVCKV